MGLTTQLVHLQRTSIKSGANVWEAIYSKHDSLFADKVMAEADWSRHRRATLRHRLEPMDLMKVMIGYAPLLVWVALLSVAIGLYDITLVRWYEWPMLSAECVETFFSSITVALTLLLVFKTNSCYDRWWEARKNIGRLTSWAHNFTRQAVAYFPPDQPQLVKALGRWTAASMWVVKSLVRQDSCLKQELRGVLLPEELDWLLGQRHKPLALGQALSTIVDAADINPMVRHQLDAMLTTYTFDFGACNRTYNTAIPSAYTRHTSRFLLCYILVGLPLLLWPMAGWASPILAVVIAFLLLGVENIAAYVEEPFYAIALDQFATNVQRDVLTIVGMWGGSSADRDGPAGTGGNNAPVIGGVTAALPDFHERSADSGSDDEGGDADGAVGCSSSAGALGVRGGSERGAGADSAQLVDAEEVLVCRTRSLDDHTYVRAGVAGSARHRHSSGAHRCSSHDEEQFQRDQQQQQHQSRHQQQELQALAAEAGPSGRPLQRAAPSADSLDCRVTIVPGA